jgi:CheY-like chemotaxis protein
VKRFLIAHQNPDMAEEIARMLSEVPEHAPAQPPAIARNRVAALAAVGFDLPDMAIIDMELPEHSQLGPAESGGLRLAQALRQAGIKIPLLLLASFTTREISEQVAALKNAGLVLEGSRFEQDLRLGVEQALAIEEPTLSPAPVNQTTLAPTRIVITIHIRGRGNCIYSVRSSGGRIPESYDISFEVKPEELDALREATLKLRQADPWHLAYESIGERLSDLLLGGNCRIIRDLGRIEGIRQSLDAQVALCFVTEKAVYPIALEALRDGYDADRHYWLERAPLWRQLDQRALEYPLFQDAETRSGAINCLVIAAGTAGAVPGWGANFGPIPGALEEARWLVDHLRSQRGVQKICRIQQDDNGQVRSWTSEGAQTHERLENGSFAEVLGTALTQGGPWHLVHFAGHTHYDTGREWGYVLLPGTPRHDGGPVELDVVSTPRFAKWLARSRLVYMSSCDSSSDDFVFALCKQAVPAVTGFRWGIEDQTALEHCKHFYVQLFQRRSLEHAMFSTWNHMYERDRANRIWASSQLVMQIAG